jgi:hypothetical protein
LLAYFDLAGRLNGATEAVDGLVGHYDCIARGFGNRDNLRLLLAGGASPALTSSRSRFSACP